MGRKLATFLMLKKAFEKKVCKFKKTVYVTNSVRNRGLTCGCQTVFQVALKYEKSPLSSITQGTILRRQTILSGEKPGEQQTQDGAAYESFVIN